MTVVGWLGDVAYDCPCYYLDTYFAVAVTLNNLYLILAVGQQNDVDHN